LTVELIADHCCFSRYYYNRLFKSVTGESVYSFIKRIRIETAAFKLIKFPHLSVTHIAAELGYSSSNFSVLFKKHYGVSPSGFRNKPSLPLIPAARDILDRIQTLQKSTPASLLEKMDRNISIRKLPAIKLAYSRYKGNYMNLIPVWQDFCDKMAHANPGADIEYYGISYDDPLIAGHDRCLYDLCARVDPGIKWGHRNLRKIRGGSYICYRFEDHISKLQNVYNDLFAVWMPRRGYIMGPGLCLERYRSGLGPDGLIDLDICIPVC
jgi:AraC family transcriptional regulator